MTIAATSNTVDPTKSPTKSPALEVKAPAKGDFIEVAQKTPLPQSQPNNVASPGLIGRLSNEAPLAEQDEPRAFNTVPRGDTFADWERFSAELADENYAGSQYEGYCGY